jgi:hypothetical protein
LAVAAKLVNPIMWTLALAVAVALAIKTTMLLLRVVVIQL